jgi:hypothetical protein
MTLIRRQRYERALTMLSDGISFSFFPGAYKKIGAAKLYIASIPKYRSTRIRI